MCEKGLANAPNPIACIVFIYFSIEDDCIISKHSGVVVH